MIRNSIITTAFIIILLCWVSFFPQPAQERYWIYTAVVLGCFLLPFLFARKDRGRLFSLRDVPLWLFLPALAGGIIAAQNKSAAVRTYLDISLTLFFLYYLCKEIFSSSGNQAVLSRTVCWCSILVAVLGIVEWVLGRNPVYEYLVDNPYYYRYMRESFRRPMSTQFNPVILGTYLLACFPFSLVLLRDKRLFFRRMGLVSIALSAVVIVFTLSRGVLLGLMALIIFYLWHAQKKWITGVFVVFLIAVMGICSYPGRDGLNRFGFKRMVCGSYDSIFSEYRWTRVKMAAAMLKDYPLWGIGLNHFRLRFNEYYPLKEAEIYEFMIADNMYLTILAETGIIGAAGFLIFIFWLLRGGRRRFYSLKDKDERYFLLAVLSGFAGLLVNMAAYELFYWRTPLIFFSLYCGIIAGWLRREETVVK